MAFKVISRPTESTSGTTPVERAPASEQEPKAFKVVSRPTAQPVPAPQPAPEPAQPEMSGDAWSSYGDLTPMGQFDDIGANTTSQIGKGMLAGLNAVGQLGAGATAAAYRLAGNAEGEARAVNLAQEFEAEAKKYVGTSPTIESILASPEKFQAALDWAAWNIGQGAATSIPVVVAALAGGVPAAAAAGYVMGVGDTYNAQVEAGATPEQRSGGLSFVAGVPYAAAEAIGAPVQIAKNLIGGTAKDAALSLPRRVVKNLVTGGVKEGVTETAQEAINIGTGAIAAEEQMGEALTSPEARSRYLNSFAAGAVAGAPTTAASAVFAEGQPSDAGQVDVPEPNLPRANPLDAIRALDPNQVGPNIIAGTPAPEPVTVFTPTPEQRSRAELEQVMEGVENGVPVSETIQQIDEVGRAVQEAAAAAEEARNPPQVVPQEPTADAVAGAPVAPEPTVKESLTADESTPPPEPVVGKDAKGWLVRIGSMVFRGIKGKSFKSEAQANAFAADHSPAANTNAGTRTAPANAMSQTERSAAAEKVNVEPTEAQKEAGNYQKGHLRWEGFQISVENPAGSIRRGTAPDGTAWESAMPVDYGYIRSTSARDGDHVDIYLGPDTDSDAVWVVDQIDPATQKYDEAKILAGFASQEQAVAAYDGTFTDGSGPAHRGAITEMSVSQIKEKLASTDGQLKRPLAWKKPKAIPATPEVASEAPTTTTTPSTVEAPAGGAASSAPAESPRQESAPAGGTPTRSAHSPDWGSHATREGILRRAKARLDKRYPKRLEIGWQADGPVLILKRGSNGESVDVANEVARQTQITIERSQRGRANRPNLDRYGIIGWIAKRGGMTDEGGDLQNMDLDRWHIGKVGMRPIIRTVGNTDQGDFIGRTEGGADLSPDGTLLAAVEAGILPETAELPDLYEAIRKAAFDADFTPRPTDEDVGREQARAALADEAAKLGETFTPEETEALLDDMAASGKDAFEAIVDATERRAIALADEFKADDLNPANDPPLPWSEDDAQAREVGAEEGDRPNGRDREAPEGQSGAEVGSGNAGAPTAKDRGPQTELIETADGRRPQYVVPGVSPITDKDRLQTRADKPMRGGNAPMDVGLFDMGARAQTDLLDAISTAPKKQEKSPSPAPTPPLAQEPAAPAQDQQPFEVDGITVYPAVNKDGVTKWLVQLPENKEKGGGIGDEVWGTKTAATEAARNLAARLREAKARMRAAEKKIKEEAEAKTAADADDLDGFLTGRSPMERAKIRDILGQKVRFSDGRVMTRRDRIDAAAADGTLVVETFEEDKIKPMTRAQFNRATQAEQDAHEKRVKEGGKKTTYLVNGAEMGKVAYDYAAHVLGRGAAAPSAQKADPPPGPTTEVNGQSQPATPLDHGVLNVPLAKRGNIDAELDRYKAEQARQKRAAEKERAQERRDDKAKARELFDEVGESMLARYQGEMRKRAAATIDKMVKWEPDKFIQMAEKFKAEQAAAASPSPAVAQLLRQRGKMVSDTSRKPTGWYLVEGENMQGVPTGSILLIHEDRNEVKWFHPENPRSGTDAIRARMLAEAYAIDHAVEAPVDKAQEISAPVAEQAAPPKRKLPRDYGWEEVKDRNDPVYEGLGNEPGAKPIYKRTVNGVTWNLQRYNWSPTTKSTEREWAAWNEGVDSLDAAYAGDNLEQVEDWLASATPLKTRQEQMTGKAEISRPVEQSIDAVMEEPPAAPKATGPYTVEEHDAFMKRLRAGEPITADELRAAFARFKAAQDEIKAELNKLKKDELKKRVAFVRSDDTKANMVASVLTTMAHQFAVSASGVQYDPTTPGSFLAAVEKLVAAETDEGIRTRQEEIAARRAQFVQTYTDPQTIDQFDAFIRTRGFDKLTQAQKTRYDELRAQAGLEKFDDGRAKPSQRGGVTGGDVTINVVKARHVAGDYDVWVGQLSDRVDAPTFRGLVEEARMLGGHYSRVSGNGAVPGFQFKTEEAAQRFAARERSGTKMQEEAKAAAQAEKSTEKLRQMADDLEAKANETLNAERKVNTARRAAQAASTEANARADAALARTMRNLADGIATGTTKFLKHLSTKAQVEEMESLLRGAMYRAEQAARAADPTYRLDSERQPLMSDVDHAKFPSPSAHVGNLRAFLRDAGDVKGYIRDAREIEKLISGMAADDYFQFEENNPRHDELVEALRQMSKERPKVALPWTIEDGAIRSKRLLSMRITDTPSLRAALREFVSFRSGRDKANPIQQMERDLIGQKIPGFFPTPPEMSSQMIERADIQPGHVVLEPEAGKGNIADAIREAAPDATLHTIEPVARLRAILEAKGHTLVGTDMLEHRGAYDRIVMNPPFENGQDVEHVRKAYTLLKPGGRLVAIMSESPFSNSAKKAQEFRDWLDEVGGTSEKNPEGSFKDSERSTGVATRMVVIDKDTGSDVLGMVPAVRPPKSSPSINVTSLPGAAARPIAGVAATAVTQGQANPTTTTFSAERVSDIVSGLYKALGVPAARQGRVSVPGALGTYNRKTGVVRTKLPPFEELEVFAHEAGHYLAESKYKGPIYAAINANQAEVEAMAYPGAPQKQKRAEGFAEFFRSYIANPAYAQAQAPNFYAAFEQTMRATDPAMLEQLQQAQQAHQQWLAMPSADAVRADMVTTERGRFSDLIHDIKEDGVVTAVTNRAHRAYGALVDEMHALSVAVDRLKELRNDNRGRRVDLKASDNPYVLARLAKDAYTAGQTDILYGVRDYLSAKNTGPSLADAMEMALGHSWKNWPKKGIEDFGAYLISRRAVLEWDRFELGLIPNRPTKFTIGDHDLIIQEMERDHPGFRAAADLIYEWADNLWRKKLDAGLITQEQYDGGRQMFEPVYLAHLQKGMITHDEYKALVAAPPPYVPFKRDVSDKTKVTKEAIGGSAMAMRFQGSLRAIINPVESLMKDAYATAMAVARNDVLLALDDLSVSAGVGAGAIVERIPASQIRPFQVRMEEAMKELMKNLGAEEVSFRDQHGTMLVAGSFDAFGKLQGLEDLPSVTLYKAGEINEKGEPILYVYRNGERVPLRLADGQFGLDLYNAVTGLGREGAGLFTNLMAYPAGWLRLGVTSDPSFFLSNMIRDQISAWVLTDIGYKPFADNLRGTYSEVVKDDFSKMYNAFGGIMGGVSTNALSQRRAMTGIKELQKGPHLAKVMDIRNILKFTEISETGTRVGVFRKAFKTAKARGLSDKSAAIEAAFVARDYIDFGRHGSRMLAARRIITFLNAAIQGTDKAVRVLSGNGSVKAALKVYFKHQQGYQLTDVEMKNLRHSAKAWSQLALLGLFGLALRYLYRDDPWYEEINDDLRATHWFVRIYGNIIAIPKPFELAFPSAIFERAFEAYSLKDPNAGHRLLRDLGNLFLPPMAAPAVAVPIEHWANKRFYDDRPIVGRDVVSTEPWRQYNAYTSDFSKMVGREINVSPAVIDHYVAGWGGMWGRNFLTFTNAAKTNAADTGLDDMFVIRRFVRDPARGATSTSKFWEQMAEENGHFSAAQKTFKLAAEAGEPGEAAAYLKSLDEPRRVYAMWKYDSQRSDIPAKAHPMERAVKALRVIKKMRDEVRDSSDYTPEQKRIGDDLLSQRSVMEARNALVVVGVEGWAQRKPISLDDNLKQIGKVSPAMAQSLERKYAAAKVLPAERVAEIYPRMADRMRMQAQKFIDDGDAAK